MFTAKDKREAVDRELGFRRRVYARKVQNGEMSKQLADKQIEVFESIREDYLKLEAGERLI